MQIAHTNRRVVEYSAAEDPLMANKDKLVKIAPKKKGKKGPRSESNNEEI